jgi:hypothetical protein
MWTTRNFTDFATPIHALLLRAAEQEIRDRPRNSPGPSAIYARVYKAPRNSGERPADACTTEKSMRVNRGPFLRNMWKTWKTRNFAGFPGSGHILGVGRWCIVRVLKPAERVSHSGRLSLNNGRNNALNWPGPKIGRGRSSSPAP